LSSPRGAEFVGGCVQIGATTISLAYELDKNGVGRPRGENDSKVCRIYQSRHRGQPAMVPTVAAVVRTDFNS
jgi:hypothetical protein